MPDLFDWRPDCSPAAETRRKSNLFDFKDTVCGVCKPCLLQYTSKMNAAHGEQCCHYFGKCSTRNNNLYLIVWKHMSFKNRYQKLKYQNFCQQDRWFARTTPQINMLCLSKPFLSGKMQHPRLYRLLWPLPHIVQSTKILILHKKSHMCTFGSVANLS